jgi:hypothetical protein
MPACRVVEYFDVIEDIFFTLPPCFVYFSPDTLPLKQLEKARSYLIIVEITSATHTRFKIVGI